MFPGPTGTNAVESALKLARKVKGRESVVSFTNAFHGMSLGSLAVTGNAFSWAGAGIPLVHGTPMPFDNYFYGKVPDFLWFERLLEDQGSGLNKPAAVIVETVQGEGGINVARPEWLRALAELCERQDMLLIVDDIQMGCGRTGAFFSFEESGITPDIVTVSKSISGYGLPMALSHVQAGTGRLGAGRAQRHVPRQQPRLRDGDRRAGGVPGRDGSAMEKQTRSAASRWSRRMIAITEENLADVKEYRGRGLVWGLEFHDKERAGRVAKRAFEFGLLIETSGPESEVVGLLPALTITPDELDEGLRALALGRARDRLKGPRRHPRFRRLRPAAAGAGDPCTSLTEEASQHRDRSFVQGDRRHRPAREGGVRHVGKQADRPRQGEGRLLRARDDPVRGYRNGHVVREPHRGRRLHQGRRRVDRPRDREDVPHHPGHDVPPPRP
ncbi:Acetylornithine/succinyldiaminopimelate aminotransferase [Streptomyces griseoloalbus]